MKGATENLSYPLVAVVVFVEFYRKSLKKKSLVGDLSNMVIRLREVKLFGLFKRLFMLLLTSFSCAESKFVFLC